MNVYQLYNKGTKREAGALKVSLRFSSYTLFSLQLKSSAKMSHNHNIFPMWAYRSGNERVNGEQSLSKEQQKSPLCMDGN